MGSSFACELTPDPNQMLRRQKFQVQRLVRNRTDNFLCDYAAVTRHFQMQPMAIDGLMLGSILIALSKMMKARQQLLRFRGTERMNYHPQM
jgi:hypothetical protein